ncbi:MAG: transposase, partial [Kofleriaceae bacterium]|nr:transposase [Kofleriaceae bacterium]
MSKEIRQHLGNIDGEFAAVDLGDKRRNGRLRAVAARIAATPSESFPKVMASIAEREALYRLLNNDGVTWEAILEPHLVASVERAQRQGVTRVVHDTTDFVFSGD